MRLFITESILAGCLLLHGVQSFTVAPRVTSQRRKADMTDAWSLTTRIRRHTTTVVWSSAGDEAGSDEAAKLKKGDKGEEMQSTKAEQEEEVGNLVADDEWEGLTMELSEMIKLAVTEDLKKNAREFLGKDEYKIGDICKEVDSRVKDGVADLRGKEEYELGDFVMAIDEVAKSTTEELTGKPYEAGDLSKEIDSRIKSTVAQFCGKDEYEFGDLTKEMTKRVQSRVETFTGREDYEFGDISREIEERRRDWVKGYLGEKAAEDYQFGDITKKAISKFTGNDEYQFGDITKKAFGNLFGKKQQ